MLIGEDKQLRHADYESVDNYFHHSADVTNNDHIIFTNHRGFDEKLYNYLKAVDY